ncbi:Carboxylesterase type B [Geosmithia morbida]|uniref:Carboxylic ester hydrolase n=1 Tax=Geosmithia morbida TaxID=1094350 RepID=A0A9P4YRC8_9HYPO|nr:Carboxylesterase type B [Geosmithia morbida]KAF4121703.1 Carboxylesterase type B [Geosmithia morbida]
MKLMRSLWVLGAVAVAGAGAFPAAGPDTTADSPELEGRDILSTTVDTPAGTIVGARLLGVDSFRGIPYAESPAGKQRLKPPKRLQTKLDNFDAKGIAPSCPQMLLSSSSDDIISKIGSFALQLPLFKPLTDPIQGQEDCLSVTVQRPSDAKEGDDLPVLYWMYGGAFELGSTNVYDAASMLRQASRQGQPFIFVAVNYRVAGWGFLPGAEVLADGSANLGLLDQRMGLEWVADNIASFGGDPTKVTIWGESAGSISVFDQMALYGGDVSYKGKPLFRGAIMNSGSIIPAEPVDGPKGQAVYDTVVEAAGCSGADDTLECLRDVDYDTLMDAINTLPAFIGYSSVALSFLPRPDGRVLPDSPDVLASSGRYHAVPMIIGDQEDEGTILSLFQSNTTKTDEDIVDYLSTNYFHGASDETLTALVSSYEDTKAMGSPFRTGILNELYPGFKRLAAILGDLVFTLTRRYFLDLATSANPETPAWSYLASYYHNTPVIGTCHASDIAQFFFNAIPDPAGMAHRTYYYNFINNLDPNVGNDDHPHWPQWSENRELLWFENLVKVGYLDDDFREDSARIISENAAELHI